MNEYVWNFNLIAYGKTAEEAWEKLLELDSKELLGSFDDACLIEINENYNE